MNGAADKEAERRVPGLSATERLLTPMALLEARSPHLWARELPPIEADGKSPALQRYLFVAPFPETQPKVARLGIFGAIHGDEIEGPLALGQFLSGFATTPQAASGFFLHLYPVCNPTGLETSNRLSSRGKDLDREFWRGSAEPEVRVLEAELTRRAFDGIISLRSDASANKFAGMVNREPLSDLLLGAALNAAETFLPVLRRVNGERRYLRPGMLQSPPHATRLLTCTPWLALLTDSSIFAAVSLAAWAQRRARLRTSSATTAKPAPASPARAASTAAFKARMLVWNAISSMVLMILAVASEDALICKIARDISPVARTMPPTVSLASAVRALHWPTLAALRCVMLDIYSNEELVSSNDAACSLAPSASNWLADATWLALLVSVSLAKAR